MSQLKNTLIQFILLFIMGLYCIWGSTYSLGLLVNTSGLSVLNEKHVSTGSGCSMTRSCSCPTSPWQVLHAVTGKSLITDLRRVIFSNIKLKMNPGQFMVLLLFLTNRNGGFILWIFFFGIPFVIIVTVNTNSHVHEVLYEPALSTHQSQ